jgi:hypothetical protein
MSTKISKGLFVVRYRPEDSSESYSVIALTFGLTKCLFVAFILALSPETSFGFFDGSGLEILILT